MPWVLIWIILVLAAVAIFAVLGRSLWRKGLALADEMASSADKLSEASARLEEARAQAPQPLAVFEDPVRLRIERERDLKARRRARQRAAARRAAARERAHSQAGHRIP